MTRFAAMVIVLFASRAQAAAPDERLAVVVGANFGEANDEPLRYAERDAQAFRDLILELGHVRSERALLVLGGGPAEVLHALREARGRAAELAQQGARVVLLFYYSGHGDDRALHLRGGNLSLEELRRELDAVPADLKLSLFDACRSAARHKGAHRGRELVLETQAQPMRGTVELWASSSGEVAQESEELGGAVFTHFLLSALRGAADFDGDGRVTLDELYAYAYRHTALRTGVSLAAQHPALTARLAGAGELELTRPTSASSTLELPPGGDSYVVYAWPTAAALAEVGKSDPRRVALSAGRYLITERRGDRFLVARADLVWRGYTRLDEREFRPIAREELVMRGGRLELHPFRLRALAGPESSPTGAAVWRGGLGLGVQWVHGVLLLQVDVGAVGGPVRTDALVGQEWSLRGGGLVAARWLLRRLELQLGVGVELRWIIQSVDRSNAAMLAGTPLQTHFLQQGGGLGPRAEAVLAVGLGHRLALVLDGAFTGLFVPLLRDANASPTMGWLPLVSFAVGVQREL